MDNGVTVDGSMCFFALSPTAIAKYQDLLLLGSIK